MSASTKIRFDIRNIGFPIDVLFFFISLYKIRKSTLSFQIIIASQIIKRSNFAQSIT